MDGNSPFIRLYSSRVPLAPIPGSRLHDLLQGLRRKHSGSGRNHARLMDRGSLSALRGQAPVSAQRHLSWEAIEAAHQPSGAESGALMGVMRRAIAREEQERAKAVDEQKRMTDEPKKPGKESSASACCIWILRHGHANFGVCLAAWNCVFRLTCSGPLPHKRTPS